MFILQTDADGLMKAEIAVQLKKIIKLSGFWKLWTIFYLETAYKKKTINGFVYGHGIMKT